MPVVEWSRTNLIYTVPNASQALCFKMTDFVAYDALTLQHPGAENDYMPAQLNKVQARFTQMSDDEKALLEQNIIAGVPGGEGSYTRDRIKNAIRFFTVIGTDGYRQNLCAFLRNIMPVTA